MVLVRQRAIDLVSYEFHGAANINLLETLVDDGSSLAVP